MKFLQIVNVRWYNATAWYAVRLSKVLKNQGHDVCVLGLPGTPPLEKSKNYGLETVSLDLNSNNPFKLIYNIYALRKLIKRFNPDVINCHRGEFFWFLSILKFFKKESFVLIRTRGDARDPKKGLLNRFFYSNADKTVVTGKIIKEKLVKNLGVPQEKIDVIYGGVDTDRFSFKTEGKRKIRDEFGFSEDDFVVGIIGRFDYVKGHKYLIESVSKIYYNNKNRCIRLFLIGFDTNISTREISDCLEKYRIQHISYISGFRDDIEDCISALDLGVIASTASETICRVAFEMMSAGIPVVASNTGVLPEIVPAQNVFRSGDVDELSDKIMHYSKTVKRFSEDDFYENYMKAVKNCKR